MLKKMAVKLKIRKLIREIGKLEKKRYRSQAALTTAILTHTTPNDEDVDYFNHYTSEISNRRNQIQELQKQLKR